MNAIGFMRRELERDDEMLDGQFGTPAKNGDPTVAAPCPGRTAVEGQSLAFTLGANVEKLTHLDFLVI